MRTNFDEFSLKIQNVNKLPQVIILTEIWINDDEASIYNLPGYVMHSKCNQSQRSGGVLVFVDNNLFCVRVEKTEIKTADIVHLKITLPDNIIIEILGIYRLHEYSPIIFTDELNIYLNLIKNKNLIVCGDININLLNQLNCVDNYLTTMANHGLECKINEPTRIKNNSKSLIDHVFIRFNVNLKIETNAWVIDSQITDHHMTALSIEYNATFRGLVSNCNDLRLDFKLLDKALSNADWSQLYIMSSVSSAFSHFFSIFKSCINKSYISKNRNKKYPKKLKPWMSDALLKKVNEKNSLYKESRTNPWDHPLRNQYRICKITLKHEIILAKNNYYKSYLETNKKDPKRQWQCVKELTGTSKKNQLSPLSVRNSSGVIESDPKLVANIFNNYFSTVAIDLRVKLDQDINQIRSKAHSLDFIKDSYSLHSIFLYPTSNTEILQIINELSTRKAPGYDSVTPAMVKKITHQIVKHLVYLINFSMSSGEFPNDLKNSIVIPLYKKSDKHTPSNFRPIALLSIFSKIFEKVIKSRLVNFLEQNKFFSKNQFGFQKKMNTENALLDFFGKVYEGVNDGDFCAGLFVDVMKAFDTVDHSILLEKMFKAGVRGIAHKWFSSYLSGRKQRVKVGEHLSDEVEIIHGIPQGSVLSGPLFLIYVNSLCNASFKGNLTAFADDTSLFYRSSSIQELQNTMQSDINLLRIWFTDNFLVMSPKTQALVFNLSSQNRFELSLKYHEVSCIQLHCNCSEIGLVNDIKYLGLFVDSRLSWKVHVRYLKNKIIKYTRIFYLIRPLCDIELLRSLYFAFVHSKLEYAVTLWGGTYSTTLKTIVSQQNSFLRIINNRSKFDQAIPLYRKLNILPFKNLYIYKVLKVYYNKSDKQREDIRNPTMILRNRLNAYVPKPKLTVYKKYFTYLAPKFFNCLPNDIRCIPRLSIFLVKLKHFLLFHDNLRVFYDCLE